MAASATDKFKKLSKRWVGQVGSGAVADNVVTTVPLASVTNLPTDTAVVAVIDRVDANGTTTAGFEETIIGVVSGSNLINCVRGAEGTAQAHNAGAVVEILVTAKGWNDLVDGLLISHLQDGRIAGSAVTASNVAASAINNGNLNFSLPTSDAWTPDTNTWTYSSADGPTGVISINADLTGIIGVGDRIKLTQTTVKYFIVTKISFSGTTTLTAYGGSDYTLANAAISATSYSHAKVPFGFNPDPAKWTEVNTNSSDNSQGSPVSGTWYNHGGSLSIPIGDWDVYYKAAVQGNTTTGVTIYATLSTANNSESDTEFTSYAGAGAPAAADFTAHARKRLLLTSKTTYYLNDKYGGTCTSLGIYGSTFFPTKIYAICAYL